eukprot:UN11859
MAMKTKNKTEDNSPEKEDNFQVRTINQASTFWNNIVNKHNWGTLLEKDASKDRYCECVVCDHVRCKKKREAEK